MGLLFYWKELKKIRFLSRATIAIIISLLITGAVGATSPTKVEPLLAEYFELVEVREVPFVVPPTATPSPSPTLKPTPKPTKKPKVDNYTKNAIIGTASWYCNSNPARGNISRCTVNHPDGKNSYYGAIRRDLLGKLRGKTVKVCEGKDCIPVKIIDCNCGKHANLIDLYADAFAHFHNLGKGRFRVTVRW